MKTRTTNSLKAEAIKKRLLVSLSPERIRHATAGNQTKITTQNGLKYRNMNLSLILEVNEEEFLYLVIKISRDLRKTGTAKLSVLK